MSNMNNQKIIQATQKWVETFVVGMNLCPFAKREIVKNRVRFITTDVTSQEQLLMALKDELELMNTNADIETTLLIHPSVLNDFYDYNDFLEIADSLLVDMDLDGVYQVASFHPYYQFGGTETTDAENFTNRSPYPMLHILREESLDKVIDNYPNIDDIPERNIKLMNDMGYEKLQKLFFDCIKK